MNYKVSIIIPNFNGKELLAKNLPKVLDARKNLANQIQEIIVVDDGSVDESVIFLKDNYPEVKVIKHKINRGFSAAVNTGVRMAKGNLVLLLNNDVLPDNDFLVNVIPHFVNKKVFAVSLHEKGFGWAKGDFKDGFIIHEPGQESKQSHKTFWVSGGSGLFRREYWMDLGGMDEKIFSPFYWEDLDLCYRAAKRGLILLWEPKGIVEHKHESTVGKLSKSYVLRIKERNYLLFNWKNITSHSLFKKHLVGLFIRILKHPGYLRIFFMALGKIRIVINRRKIEIKESKVSDEAFFASFNNN